ncbi:class I histocompatibility antigen, F10 alpha chain-like, partial [Apteryx rowi]|uniref:class I histocompatibility antigen, F10 alpha chain-like n=1 Tax=Apteryx rowi TaxID=308060 RepID=UPI000E1CC6E9
MGAAGGRTAFLLLLLLLLLLFIACPAAGDGFHTFQYTYGCEVGPEGLGGAYRRLAFDGRDFLSFDVARQRWDALAPEAGATQRLWNGAAAALRYYHNFAMHECPETLQRFLRHEPLEPRTERPTVRVSGKESDGLLTLSCRAHGFYPRPIAINWLRKGRVQAQETKRGSTAPNSDGTYHAWASIEALAAEKDEYQCRVEHASLPEPGLFSWGERGHLEVAES